MCEIIVQFTYQVLAGFLQFCALGPNCGSLPHQQAELDVESFITLLGISIGSSRASKNETDGPVAFQEQLEMFLGYRYFQSFVCHVVRRPRFASCMGLHGNFPTVRKVAWMSREQTGSS